MEKIKFGAAVKRRLLLPYVCCLILAMIVWLVVLYIAPPMTVVEHTDIPVEVRINDALVESFNAAGYEISYPTVIESATFSGSRMAHAKCEGNIKAVVSLDMTIQDGTAAINLPVTFEFPKDVTLTPETTPSILLTVTPKTTP